MNRGGWIIAFTATTHLVWCVLLVVSPWPLLTVPLAGLAFIGQRLAAFILGGISLSAYVGLCCRPSETGATFLWAFPQQLLLTLTALSATVACLEGEYADGTARPWVFVCADQTYAILVAIFHGGALIERYRLWKRWRSWYASCRK